MSADDVKAEKHKNLAMSAELEYFKDQPFILLNPDNDTGKRANKLFKKQLIVRLSCEIFVYLRLVRKTWFSVEMFKNNPMENEE
jgi:hypothetical protein